MLIVIVEAVHLLGEDREEGVHAVVKNGGFVGNAYKSHQARCCTHFQ